jgi:translation initiation factor 1
MASKKKSLNSFEDLGKLWGLEKEPNEPTQEKTVAGLPKTGQTLELHFSKKGRAGKIVTVISGISADDDQIKILAKELKTRLGVGGSVKNHEIVIQGNLRDKIARILQELGYKTKNIGG